MVRIMLEINDIYNTIQPVVNEVGEAGAVGGIATMVSASANYVVQTLRGNSSIRHELRNPVNYTVGALGAGLSLASGQSITPEQAQQAMGYVGSSMIGAGFGGAFRAFKNNGDALKQRVIDGATRGAVSFPVAYGTLEYLCDKF